jgi:hypothetical protein
VLARDGENLGIAAQTDGLLTTPRIGDDGDNCDGGVNAALRLR